MKIIIAGGGIAGLTLACRLAQDGIIPEVYDAAPRLDPIGLGVNILPHAGKALQQIGILDEIAKRSIETFEATFFNRYGPHIYSEPAGLRAGYELPQYSVHRGDLHEPLIDKFIELAGADHLHLNCRCIGFEQTETTVTAFFEDAVSGESLKPITGDVLIGAEGIHSRIRKQLHPSEGDPVYSGVNMWRGSAIHKPFLEGANMIRIGWLATGKLVLYPMRNNVDGKGGQLINWVVEVETPHYKPKRDWNKEGNINDFIHHFDDMKFEWLDIPSFLRSTERILEYPMVDQDPLPFWTEGRVTLIGDAAHPMYPRGSNGACQAIVDGITLGEALLTEFDPRTALKRYEAERLPVTTQVVLSNRKVPPDIILQEVYRRTGDKPFNNINDVISAHELASLSNNYKQIAGYSREQISVS